jgi:hypothetical protein
MSTITRHDISILKGKIGQDPMVASFLVHAVIEEASRIVNRMTGGVLSVTVSKDELSICVGLKSTLTMEQKAIDLENLRVLFSEIARVAYVKAGGTT